MRTRSSAHNASPMAGASMPVTILITPSGNPARLASSASASADKGVCSAGFSTQVQPAASPGDNLRVIIAFGKFHGVIAPNTPTGCFSTRNFLSGNGLSRTSPATRLASSANQSMKLVPYKISPLASARGLPISAVSRVARSSACSRHKSFQRRRMAARSLAVVAAQPLRAASAASIAAVIPSAPKSATSATMSPVDGFFTANRLSCGALTKAPLIKASVFSRDGSESFIIRILIQTSG